MTFNCKHCDHLISEETLYFLFGGQASEDYNDYPFKDFLKCQSIKDGDFGLHEHKPEDSPVDLLLAFVGWSDFAQITEAEYKKLSKKLKQ